MEGQIQNEPEILTRIRGYFSGIAGWMTTERRLRVIHQHWLFPPIQADEFQGIDFGYRTPGPVK
jgi:hypothetical protein